MYDALRGGLPAGWYAWHSLRVRDPGGFDGEGDFVLAVPGRGLLVLEVKGGQVSVRDGRWLQNGQAMKQPPRDQGISFAKKLIARLRARDCAPHAWGVAVCFPDVGTERGPTQGDLNGVVLGAQDLGWIGEALPALVERALPAPRAERGRWIEALHEFWGETWVPKLSLAMRARRAESDRIALDQTQLEALDALADNDRVLVEGGAGTGKTLLAMECARRAAASGQRVLLTCFTAALAEHLRTRLDGTGVDVHTVRKIAKDLIEQAGRPTGDLTQPDTWEQNSWRASELVTDSTRYDVVVVDEAQDLELADFALIEKLALGGRLWLFRDARQSFWPERDVPSDLVTTRYRLTRAYRMPAALARVADSCLLGVADGDALGAATANSELVVTACASEGAANARLEVVLDGLRGQGLAPGEIAVVSLRGQSSSDSVVHAASAGRHRLARADAPDAGDFVVADTFLRFKGLERPAIVIVDLDQVLEKSDLGVRLHIALTRTLVTAQILASRQALQRVAALGGVAEA